MSSNPGLERSLYPPVRSWLEKWLRRRYKNVVTFDTSDRKLTQVVPELGISEMLPDHWVSWDIRVDILGIGYNRRSPNEIALAFVECKTKPINLQHLGQLLGYCLVANPAHAFLISPAGISNALFKLLDVYRRESILLYGDSRRTRKIYLARWDVNSHSIVPDSILPRGTGIM